MQGRPPLCPDLLKTTPALCYNSFIPCCKRGGKDVSMQKRKHLIWLPILAVFLFAAGMLGFELIVSFVKYSPLRGFGSSEAVGLMYYERLFANKQIVNSFLATLLYDAVTILPSLALGVLTAALLGLIRNRPVKAGLAGMALLAALAPAILWEQLALNTVNALFRLLADMGLMASVQSSLQTTGGAVLVITLARLVPQTALCVFAGLALSLSQDTPAWRGALAAALIPMLTFLLPDIRTSYLVSNALNQELTMTTSCMVYQYAFGAMQYSQVGALQTFSRVIGLIPAMLPVLAIGSAVKHGARQPRIRQEGYGWMIEALAALLCSVAVFLILSLLGGLLQVGHISGNDRVLQSLLVSIATSMISFFPAMVFCLFVLLLSRYSDGRGTITYGILALLIAMAGTAFISPYTLTGKLDMFNTLFGIALNSLGNPVFLAVLIILVMLRPTTWRQAICLAMGGAFIAAACTAGDFFIGRIFSNNVQTRPLGTMLHLVLQEGARSADAAEGMLGLLTVISLLISLPGVALVMAGAGGSKVSNAVDPVTGKPVDAPKPTNRLGLYETSLAAAIFLPMLTMGIFQIVWLRRMIKSHRNMQGIPGSSLGELLLFMFVPFYSWYWVYTRARDFSQKACAKGYQCSDSSTVYLVLSIFGLGWLALLMMQNDINTVAAADRRKAAWEKAKADMEAKEKAEAEAREKLREEIEAETRAKLQAEAEARALTEARPVLLVEDDSSEDATAE